MKKFNAFAIVECGDDIKYPDFPITGIQAMRVDLLVTAVFRMRKNAVTAKKESDERMRRMGMKPLSVKIVKCEISYK